jgi:peptide/nickel transport system permease protein
MPFKLEILWTDALIYLLLVLIAVFCWHIRRHEHLLAPWRKVARSASGMSAATVLVFFVAIGLADSLHYRPAIEIRDGKAIYAVEVHSVFDALAGGLRAVKATTYSAPLATHRYSRELIELPNGRQVHEYPRLKYGGAHLRDPDTEWGPDIAQRCLYGVAGGALVWLIAVTLLCALLARRGATDIDRMWRAVWRGETEIPWRAILLTLAVMLAIGGPIVALAGKYHVLGTDKVGQDVLYQALKSIRTGLLIGTLTTLIMLPFAILFGAMAGYFKGLVDDAIQYVYTTLSSIPSVLLIAAAVLMMQVYIEIHSDRFETTIQRADFRLFWLCFILGVANWTSLCRLIRGETLKLREMEYIQAAKAFGVSDLRIIARHIVPNVMHIVLITAVLNFSGLVLAEAVLTYIGVGVDPTMMSFGGMINSARLEMAREPIVWWSLAAAFSVMLLLVLSANLFADAVRDAFDPRIRAARPFRLAAQKA